MKLFYSPGSCSLAVHIVLREIGRNFELERVDLRTHRTSAGRDFYAINPKGSVPALALDPDEYEILTEAPAVLPYVGDLAPHLMLAPPSGSIARYRMHEWLSFLSSELHAQFGPLFKPETPEPVKEWQRGTIAERLLFISQDLVDKAYLMGESFTVCDAYLYSMLRWCDRFDMDLQLWPNVDDYYLRIDNRVAVQQSLVAEGLIEPKRASRMMPTAGSAHP